MAEKALIETLYDGPVLVQRTSDKTLSKYGIDWVGWVALFLAQGSVCAVCKKLPPSGRLVIDHEHVKGWKKLPPEQRKRLVRGILCWTCNLFVVGRGATIARLLSAAEYLRKSEARR